MSQPATGGSSVNRDLGAKLKAVQSITAIVGNNTTEGTGVAVDLKGYEGALVLFNIGNSLDTLSGSVYVTLSVQDSDNGSTGWADLASTKYRIDEGSLLIDDPAEDSIQTAVTVLAGAGVKRYIRPLITFTGTHTNGFPIGATVIKGFPRVESAA
jgi:hypothetical protein